MLSLTCKASIKAVIYLGSIQDADRRASIKEIAEYIGENEHTVGKLLQRLVHKKIIHSVKGPHGGFYITEQQAQQPIIRVVEAIDGQEVYHHCGLGLNECNDSRPCPFQESFKPIREQFQSMCISKRICDLYENVNKGLTYLAG